MWLSACGDGGDPNQSISPVMTPDSGLPGAMVPSGPPITSGMNPPLATPGGTTGGTMVTPGVTPGLDGGAPAIDSGLTAPDGGVADEGGTTPTTMAPPCTGKPGMRRGKSNQTMMAGGASRSFIYYAPEGLDPNTPVPLLIIPHGTNMSGQGMFDLTQYSKLADREKFVAIFPDGFGGPGTFTPWNVGQNICGLGAAVGTNNDDKSFMDELIKFAAADQCIDEQHVFMTGFSMGGYFSNENGCMNPKIHGIGPHSGGTHPFTNCVNKHMPAIVFHFENDWLIDYACGVGAKDNWVKQNGCMPTNPDVVTVKGGKCEYYKGCPADGQVALCSFMGADTALPPGHAWSGGVAMGDNAFAASPDTENAAELGWAFFKKYAW